MTLSTGNDSSNNNGGLTFFGMLVIAFIVFKLTGVIQWSWWKVLAPLWDPALLIILIAAVVIISRRQ